VVTGRDGSLPTRIAHGSAPGAVPRRALLVVTAGSLGTLLVVGVTGLPLESTLLMVTGAFTTVYVVGTAAALRLLPRATGAWRCAAVSFVATLGLLVLTGRHMLASMLIAVGALVWTSLTRRATEPAERCPAVSTP
jgi:amino acid efflux transporter